MITLTQKQKDTHVKHIKSCVDCPFCLIKIDENGFYCYFTGSMINEPSGDMPCDCPLHKMNILLVKSEFV